MVSRFLSWLIIPFLDSVRQIDSVRFMVFPHVHYFAVTDTEIYLPLSPCCIIPLQLCTISLTSVFSSQLGLAALNHSAPPVNFATSVTLLPFSRSYTNMWFNTGLSDPHWTLLGNSLHCQLGPYLCPLCCIFSLVANSEVCIPTYILTTQMLNSPWWGTCSKPFENPNRCTSEIVSHCLHTSI